MSEAPRRPGVSFVLHSHLPYYRRHGVWPFGEENLYQAMAETYLPLVAALERLLAKGLPARFTVGVTPILAEQLADPDMIEGFVAYVEAILGRVEGDRERYAGTGDPRETLSDFWLDWYQARLAEFEALDGDLLGAFRRLEEAGAIALVTSGATHAFSPLLATDESLVAQFRLAVETHERHFGKKPEGLWLPECAYRPAIEDGEGRVLRPAIDAFLAAEGLRFFFTDAPAIEGGTATGYVRQIGVYGAIEYLPLPERPATGLSAFSGYYLPDNGVAVYARHTEAGRQVWSAGEGYPGDPCYREFHKKDGASGMPYWRVTGPDCPLDDKAFYEPEAAAARVRIHAAHYAERLEALLAEHEAETGEAGHLTVPFDTELFGHWWFEGVDWLEAVVEALEARGAVARETIPEALAAHPPTEVYALPESTWGAGGHYHVWLNAGVEFFWPIIHRCEARMRALVAAYPEPPADPLLRRALDQALRELLLLQGSDWPFLVTTGQAKTYAIGRFFGHVERFEALSDALWLGGVDEAELAEAEGVDNPFAGLDYRIFRPARGMVEPLPVGTPESHAALRPEPDPSRPGGS